jgi:hypothetical protein
MSLYSQYIDSWKLLLVGTIVLTAIYGGYKILNLLLASIFSPLNDLPGPKSPSFLFGNFRDIFKADPGELHKKWVTEYGTTLASRHARPLLLRG